MTRKSEIPFWYWPFWSVLLGIGLIAFYVVLTPIWIGLRAIAWLAELRSRGRST